MSDHSPDDNPDKNDNDNDDNIQTPSITTDQLLEVLSDRTRRIILDHLQKVDGNISDIGALIDCVGDHTRTQISSSQRRNISAEIVHVHLPLLEEAGLVEYDKRSKSIRYYPHPVLEKWLVKITGCNHD